MKRTSSALLWPLLWLWLGCADTAPEPVFLAPADARAALVLEPPVVAAGQVAALDLVVVSAPDASLRPVSLPDRVDGFFLVEREPLAVVDEPARRVHRVRLRLRAIEVGRFAFPGGSVEIETSEGGTQVVHYDALPLEVVSVVSAHPNRRSPYGVRLLPLRGDVGVGSLGAFAAGAAIALAGVGLLLLVRRQRAERARRDAAASGSGDAPPPWHDARRALAAAADALAADPRDALDRTSLALRRYAVRRFGGDANVRTSEELVGATPPFTLTTRWSRFVALLQDLDAARFPASVDPARARALHDRARAFVEETVPNELAG